MKPSIVIARKALAKGFTLVEMVIVVAVIGILIALVAPSMGGSRDGATSKLLMSVSQNIANSVSLFSSTAGLSPDATTTYLGGTTNVADMVFKGRSFVATDYQKYWDQTGLLPLAGGVAEDPACTGTGGGYRVANFCVSLTVSASSMTVKYDNLTPGLALRLAQSANPSTNFTKESTGSVTVTPELAISKDGSAFDATFTKTFNN